MTMNYAVDKDLHFLLGITTVFMLFCIYCCFVATWLLDLGSSISRLGDCAWPHKQKEDRLKAVG